MNLILAFLLVIFFIILLIVLLPIIVILILIFLLVSSFINIKQAVTRRIKQIFKKRKNKKEYIDVEYEVEK